MSEFLHADQLREADRGRLFLLPPSVADRLPENRLAFFVLDVVSELDLAAFYAEYREDVPIVPRDSNTGQDSLDSCDSFVRRSRSGCFALHRVIVGDQATRERQAEVATPSAARILA
jgi:hypothetical protein